MEIGACRMRFLQENALMLWNFMLLQDFENGGDSGYPSEKRSELEEMDHREKVKSFILNFTVVWGSLPHFKVIQSKNVCMWLHSVLWLLQWVNEKI